MAKENRSQYPLLGLLTWGPMSGYAIKKAIDISLSFFWSEGFGAIYPTLKQMEAEGLVERVVTESPPPKLIISKEAEADTPPASPAKGKGREQITYAITPEGRAKLAHWLTQPPQPDTVRDEGLLKLFFGSHTPLEGNIRLVEGRLREHQETLATLELIQRQLEAVPKEKADRPYWLMAVNNGLHYHRAMRDWCIETLAQLETMRKERASPHTSAE